MATSGSNNSGAGESALVSGMSGAASGIIALVATYPLLTATTRQQTATMMKREVDNVKPNNIKDDNAPDDHSKVSIKAQNVVHHDTKWRSQSEDRSHADMQENEQSKAQMEQLLSLYDGLIPALLGTTASQGVYYYFYALLMNQAMKIARRNALSKTKNGAIGASSISLSPISNLIVASLAGIVNVLLTNPIWLVVTRLQVLKDYTKNKISGRSLSLEENKDQVNRLFFQSAQERLLNSRLVLAIREVFAEGGLQGFWKGVFPSLIMVSNPAISYTIFEYLSKRRQDRKQALTAQANFVNGAIAKLGATVVTYPLQLVKSRLQAASKENDKTMHYKGILNAIKQIAREDGILGFFHGMETKIFQSVFAAALLFAIQKQLKEAISNRVASQAVRRRRSQ